MYTPNEIEEINDRTRRQIKSFSKRTGKEIPSKFVYDLLKMNEEIYPEKLCKKWQSNKV